MNIDKILAVARKHLGDNTSARVCFADAIACYNEGEYGYAAQRALKSLHYSVGGFHVDYKRVSAHVNGSGE